MKKRFKAFLLGAGALFLLLLPAASPGLISPYYLDLVTKVLIFGIALLGYDILAGYTGLVSLGHALFFGIGGYCTAYIATQFTTNLLPILLFALVTTWIVGIIVGYFSTQTKDIFFVFLTLAFAQFFYLAAFNLTTITGGDNGVTIPKITLGIPYVWEMSVPRPFQFYYLVVTVFLMSYVICRKIIQSPFGQVLIAIRENEERVSFLGFNVRRLKVKSYMISISLTAVAGVLFAAYQDFVSPGIIHWSISGDFILMSVLGGMGTLIGPVLGGAIVILLGDWLSSITENWMIFIGLLFVLMIIFAPNGIVGFFTRNGRNGK